MNSTKTTCPNTNGNGFYTLTKDKSVCVHPAVKCSLGADSVYDKNSGTQLQPCYNNDGKVNPYALPKPAPSGGGSSTPAAAKPKVPTLANQCAALMPFGGDSNGTPKIILDIESLQATEKDILTKMQALVGTDGNVKNMARLKELLDQLKPIQDARIRLLKQLNYVSSSSQCSLSGDRKALQDQLAMVILAENQLKDIEKRTESLINAKNSKHRMVQITNYEYERYLSHANIFKNIAFCSLFILGGIYVNSLGWSMLGNSIIVLSIAVCLVMVVRKIYDNLWRSPMNWNRYEWDASEQHGKHMPTVWEVDKRFFDRGVNQIESGLDSAYNEADKYVNKAERGVDKAYGDIKNAYGDVKKNVTKDISKATSAMSSKKGSMASEGFAPFN